MSNVLKNQFLNQINDLLFAQTGKIVADGGFELCANVNPLVTFKGLKAYVNGLDEKEFDPDYKVVYDPNTFVRSFELIKKD